MQLVFKQHLGIGHNFKSIVCKCQTEKISNWTKMWVLEVLDKVQCLTYAIISKFSTLKRDLPTFPHRQIDLLS
jgi:hypothetical protein